MRVVDNADLVEISEHGELAPHLGAGYAAIASLKVRTAFGYQAVVLGLSFRDLKRSCAQSVTIENRPSKTGVVRRVALSDHWRSVSTPRCRRVSLECDLDLPAADEPGEDVAWMGVEIGRQEGLRFELPRGIADEEPADRHLGSHRRDTKGPCRWRPRRDGWFGRTKY